MPRYARTGIREAWLVDLNARRLEVYRAPSGGAYRDIRVFAPGETVTAAARHRHVLHRIQGRRDAETRDLDEKTQIDVDDRGNVCAITIEHTRERTDVAHVSYEQIGA